MTITAEQLEAIAGGKSSPSRRANIASVLAGLETYGAQAGLDQPHRLLHFVAQIAHESGGFNHDREVWGPTPAQRGYDTRTDLGNTPEKDGDGKKYMGRTPMQITGLANTAAFRDWCREAGLPAPDFVANPDLMNTDPWEGLGPIWYWMTKNLNRFADANDIEMVTKRINGGLNGLDDRIELFERTALVMLGRSPSSLKAFQGERGLVADGICGPKSRAALFGAVKAMGSPAAEPITLVSTIAAPVVAQMPRPDLIGRPQKVVEEILKEEGSRTIAKADEIAKDGLFKKGLALVQGGGLVAFLPWFQSLPAWFFAFVVGLIAVAGIIFYLEWRTGRAAKEIKVARVDDAITGNASFGGVAPPLPAANAEATA